jgi:hypothetical protein
MLDVISEKDRRLNLWYQLAIAIYEYTTKSPTSGLLFLTSRGRSTSVGCTTSTECTWGATDGWVKKT